jgi:putative phosphoserine phosphatase/1-acylglycerol-3-phosphate O-acyltransferase
MVRPADNGADVEAPGQQVPASARLSEGAGRPPPAPSPRQGYGCCVAAGAAVGAAFFDLDRTLLRGASGPAINDALVAAGLTARRLPGQGLLFKAYDLMGETAFSIGLARAAALASRGMPRKEAVRVGEAAAPLLEAIVSPYARPLMEDHRRAGRLLVMATTTPYDLVAPLAERLGFDDVVATRYEERDGLYTGGISGGFVWATGKLSAVRRWSGANGVALGESFAYSDSIYDAPLLVAVGHPVAVNPDPRLRALALVARWPVVHLDVPPGVPKVAGIEPFDLVRLLARPELFPYAQFDIGPVEGIPASGPVIVVANHRSYFDVATLGLVLARRGRPVRFLAKRELFEAPVVGQLALALGGIPVDRGTGSDRPLREAERILEAGELVVVLPQGTIPRGPKFFEPRLEGKTGAARLAASTGAPVVPVGIWGSEHVWPRRTRLPRMTKVLHPPLVRVRVGRPIPLGLDDPHRDTERIMKAIAALLPPEARRRRRPSLEEIELSYPPGQDRRAAGADGGEHPGAAGGRRRTTGDGARGTAACGKAAANGTAAARRRSAAGARGAGRQGRSRSRP